MGGENKTIEDLLKSTNDWKESIIIEAKREAKQEILLLDCIQKILNEDENQTLAIEVNVFGIKIGLVMNHEFALFLNKEIAERQKCLKGEKNLFE